MTMDAFANEFMRETGPRLLQARLDAGLKQETVARAMGVSDSAISSWERGQSTISAPALYRLEAYYAEHVAALRRVKA